MYLHILGRYLIFLQLLPILVNFTAAGVFLAKNPAVELVQVFLVYMLCYNETPNSMNNTHSTVETGSCILEYVKFFFKDIMFCVKVQFILYN